MRTIQPPLFLRWLYREIKWSFPSHKGELHFSFDDGPNPNTTPKILAILKRYDAKATFFCSGENIERYPHLLQDIINEGHKIGNHGYHHLQSYSSNKIIENAQKGADVSQSKLYRPPYGIITPKAYSILKKDFKIIMWNIMPYDFDVKQTPEGCALIVKKLAQHGSIIVFHDNDKSAQNCLNALPPLLEHFSKSGFKFTSIKNQLTN